MSKKKCNIVKDLLPNYIENEVSNDTKEFIEEHINKCKECNDILSEMKRDIIKEEQKIKENTEVEAQKLKRVKKKFKVLKTILIVSSIIVLILAGIFSYNHFSKTYLFNKIKRNYEKNTRLENYHFRKQVIYENHLEEDLGDFVSTVDIYCKDGRYVEYDYFAIMDTEVPTSISETIKYGNIDSTEQTSIHIGDKKIIKSSNVKRKDMWKESNYKNILNKFKYEEIEIKTFEEKEWYVYKEEFADGGVKEYWIDKETLTNARLIESYEKYYREYRYTISKNTVTDDDMKISYDTSGFEYVEM